MARMVVEHTSEGALPKPAPVFAETRAEDMFGRLATGDAATTLVEMQAALPAQARRRHAKRRAAHTRMSLHRR